MAAAGNVRTSRDRAPSVRSADSARTWRSLGWCDRARSMRPERQESVTTESDSVDGRASRARISDRRGEPRPARDYDRSHKARAKTYARELGPGLITGAADDDPSGISTYSQ